LGRRIEIQVRRNENHLRLWFTVAAHNWRTYTPGVAAFELARALLLLLALIVAFRRPREPSANFLALILAMIAVGEAFPKAGWASALRHLPAALSVPVLLASVSWLLIAIPWLLFCAAFARPFRMPSWLWKLLLAPLGIFGPLMVLSATAFIYAPSALAMPSTFLDSGNVRFIQSVVGVIPSTFINAWPWYRPATETLLMNLWLAWTIVLSTLGFGRMMAVTLGAREETERRRLRRLAVALVLAGVVIGHNIIVRNWDNLFRTMPPAIFSTTSFAAEAVAFSFVALTLAHAVLKASKWSVP
jgi:hypothetical protein